MQVKISFTVDMEEVPKKVDDALTESIKQLSNVTEGRMLPVTKDNIVESMRWIDNARKILLRVDTRMMECYSMLAGYNKSLAESLMPEQANDGDKQDADIQS